MIGTKEHLIDAAKQGVKEYWDYGSRFYDKTPGLCREDEERIWVEELSGALGQERKNVIDVGTGTGYIAMLLGKMGHQVTGVDFSPSMLEVARRKTAPYRSNVTIQEGDVENLPFPQGAFDALTARYVLWTQPRPEAAIREWIRVVKPGGRVVIIDGYWEMKGLLRRISRFNFQLYRTLKFGKRPRTDQYKDDLFQRIPHARGIHMGEIAKYMDQTGLENITSLILHRIRKTQKRHAPWYLKYAYDYPIYLLTGTVPDRG